MPLIFRIAIAALLVSFVAGCSNRMSAISATFQDSFGTGNDLRNSSVVNNVEGPSIFLTINGRTLLFLPLEYRDVAPQGFAAEVDGGVVDLWRSADQVIFITQYGQLVQTQNWLSNRTYTQYSETNPFERGLLNIHYDSPYSGQLSWQPNNHQRYPFTSTFTRLGAETLKLVLGDVMAVRVQEVIYVESINLSYTNHYWIHPSTGEVLQSDQLITPNGDSIRIEVGRPFNAESLL